ncbi:hypothetical protein Mapa_006594 [Marchantia paleacea]|nr:hypothetical protein Mapa_006594 [Marchantia paleacea]
MLHYSVQLRSQVQLPSNIAARPFLFLCSHNILEPISRVIPMGPFQPPTCKAPPPTAPIC